MKDASTVISEFNDIVNMSTDELKAWIETSESKDAGWTGGDGDGETVGHQSAVKIIDILERNPDKKEGEYSDPDVEHMRKVVSYCKRHLAQESHMVEEKGEAELKETKSYKSLKNWGHDVLKVKHEKTGSKSETKDESTTQDQKRDESKDASTTESKTQENRKDEPEESTEEKAEVGEKRKASAAEPTHENGKNGGEHKGEPEAKKSKKDEDTEAEKPAEDDVEEKDEEVTPTKKRGQPPKSTEKSDE